MTQHTHEWLELGRHGKYIYLTCESCQNKAIRTNKETRYPTFEHGGVAITDPDTDETGRFPVSRDYWRNGR